MVTSSLHSNMIPGNIPEPDTEHFFPGFGEVDASGAANNIDIWDGPTVTQPEPDTGGFALFVESSDAADNLTGTGIQKIEVHYLDTTGVEQDVYVELAGLTPVDTGITDCMFVNDMHAIQVGSTGAAVGDVDSTSATGGTVVARISATQTRALSTMKQVPAGKNLIITGWFASGVAGTVKIANVRLRASQHSGSIIPGVYHFLSSVRVKDSSSPWIPVNYKISPLATVKVSAWTTGAISLSAQWNSNLESI